MLTQDSFGLSFAFAMASLEVTRLSILSNQGNTNSGQGRAFEKMLKATVRTLSFVVALLLSTGFAFGQRLTGALSVQVVDPEGKTVSDVKATVLGKDRGNRVNVVSDSEGHVVVADLAPGDYQLTLEHDGFRTVNADFSIRVGLTTSLDFKMELGSVSSSVVVELNSITVDTDKSTVQGIIQSTQIDALPLNGRNFLDLVQQAPACRSWTEALSIRPRTSLPESPSVAVQAAARVFRSTGLTLPTKRLEQPS
jgi:hypothetical protein